MANANITASVAPEKLSPDQIANELHAIAARLAGVTEALHLIVDDGHERGNVLYLLAEATKDANSVISINADRVSDLSKGGAQ